MYFKVLRCLRPLTASAVLLRWMHGKGLDRTIYHPVRRKDGQDKCTQVHAWIEHKVEKTPLCAKHYKTLYKAFTAPIPYVSFGRRPTREQRFTRISVLTQNLSLYNSTIDDHQYKTAEEFPCAEQNREYPRVLVRLCKF